MGSGVSKDGAGKFYFSYTTKLTPEFLEKLDDIATAPCLFQKYIPKKLELRINVVENQAFACAIYSQQSERSTDWTTHLRRFDEVFNLQQEILVTRDLLSFIYIL